MNLKWIHRWKKYVSKHMHKLKQIVSWYYYEIRGYPLTGILAGKRMRGESIGLYDRGEYEPDVCQTIIRLVQPGWVCVDVGAHLGYFAIIMAKLVGEFGSVFAFEPHPENARELYFNMKINRYRGLVRIENLAVSDGTCQWENLHPAGDGTSTEWSIVDSHRIEENTQEKTRLKVPAISLDAYFQPPSKVNFVKIDIEGAEAKALYGMRRILQESRPFIIIEFHDENGWIGRQELFRCGYRLCDIKNNRWISDKPDAERVYHCLAVPNERQFNGVR